MAVKVLIVDDEPEIISFIQSFLTLEGYESVVAYDGAQALDLVTDSIDIILLDVMMPYQDGYEVCKFIKSKYDIPIIFITAKDELEDRLKSFSSGGDDYLQKPFYLEELQARIQNLLKRSSVPLSTVKVFGNLRIDYTRHEVFFKDNLLTFTNTEFQIIELLSLNQNQIFSKEDLYSHLSRDGKGLSGVIVEHIRKIRQKLEYYGAEDIISTVWGVGYKWKK